MIFASPDEQLANAHAIFDYFKPLIGQNGALAAVVNAFCESSLTPKAIGDHDQAFGLWQLHPDRIALIVKGCGIDIQKLPPVADQCEAIWWELQNPEHHALSLIRSSVNSHDATQAWAQFYERPASKTEPIRRAGLAASWATKLGLTL